MRHASEDVLNYRTQDSLLRVQRRAVPSHHKLWLAHKCLGIRYRRLSLHKNLGTAILARTQYTVINTYR